MARDKVISSVSSSSASDDVPKSSSPSGEESLRPNRLADVVGQRAVVDRLAITVDAAKKKNEALPHLLLDGPPGLGKTTLAYVLPRELGVDITMTSGPALSAPKDVMPYLTNLSDRSVLFIDEIHRMPRAVEEFIYPAMEDYRVDFVVGDGLGARTISMPLKKFTLIGATTRSGLLSAPFRDRFVLNEHLDFYSDDELSRIILINAKKLSVPLSPSAATMLASRSRSTPRIANSHLLWVRSYAVSKGISTVDVDTVLAALQMQDVDTMGLDRQDRKYLETLIRVFSGGPTGVEALAATMNLAVDTLSEEVEPFLLRKELIVRTPRGRRATTAAYTHLGALPAKTSETPLELF